MDQMPAPIDLCLLELRWMAAMSLCAIAILYHARKVLENAYSREDGKLAIWLALTLFIWVYIQW